MKYINISDICHINFDFCDLEVFPESWTKRHEFYQYENTERPSSALFLVCTDISATFYPRTGGAITAQKGDVVFIPKGSLYRVWVKGGSVSRIDTYTLNFRLRDENGEDIVPGSGISVVYRDENRIIESYVESIASEVAAPGGEHTNYLKIKSGFYALLDRISSSRISDNGAYYPIKLGAEALKNEWNKNERIEKYADMCGVSATYFYKCFKKWSGSTPVEYRNLLRISKARAMLIYTDMKVSEISDTVGFEDPFYFCRVFKKYYGVSPKSLRKKQK